MNLRSTFNKINDSIPSVSGDDVLEALGLERRRSAVDKLLPTFGIFAAGLLVGAGVAMLLAPKTGAELRQQIGGGIGGIRQRLSERNGVSEGDEARHHRGGLPQGV